jgi:hypothetical protein
MIAVDTNILVYAQREESPFHSPAKKVVTDLAEGSQLWAIPWPCLHEFIVVITHPRIYTPSTPLDDVLKQIDYWLESPHLVLIGESGDYWPGFKELLRKGRITGPRIHDAKIMAVCLQNGVKTLWSADRDFTRMEGLEIRNPLI